MTIRDAFTLGSKWIGVYCLAGAVGDLFKIFSLTATYDSRLIFEWSGWLSLVRPTAFLTMGIYLLRNDFYLRQFALHESDDRSIENSQDFFEISVRLFGLYLIARVIPTCLWIFV